MRFEQPMSSNERPMSEVAIFANEREASCEICGATFQKKRKTHYTCSEECSTKRTNTMSKSTSRVGIMGGATLDSAIVTMRHVETGHIFTAHGQAAPTQYRNRRAVSGGGVRVAKEDALRQAQARIPGEWEIICISTPNTIYRDIKGHRDPNWRRGKLT